MIGIAHAARKGPSIATAMTIANLQTGSRRNVTTRVFSLLLLMPSKGMRPKPWSRLEVRISLVVIKERGSAVANAVPVDRRVTSTRGTADSLRSPCGPVVNARYNARRPTRAERASRRSSAAPAV